MDKPREKWPFLYFSALIISLLFVFSMVAPISAEDQDELEEDIEDVQKKLEREEAAKAKLEQNLGQIQGQVNSTVAAIQKTESLIDETEATISRKESEIAELERRIDLQRGMIRNLVQEFYYSRKVPLLEVVLSQAEFSQALIQADGVFELEQKIEDLSADLKESKEKIGNEKNELEGSKQEHERLLALKEEQKQELLEDKYETQEAIEEKEATIGELQQKMFELKSDLNRILGKSYDTEEIKEAIKFANKITGVRKGFLFGMLSMESGGNPLAGNCDYDNCSMSKSRKNYFDKICDELGYSEKKCHNMPVSCAPKSYPGTGGAMGAAQFMSDTWWGYKSKIAAATGNNPPNPWDLLDGVVAMALKLENDGATEDGTVRIISPCNGKKIYVKWETYASMKYLGWSCYALTNYAPGIQSLAKGYDKL